MDLGEWATYSEIDRGSNQAPSEESGSEAGLSRAGRPGSRLLRTRRQDYQRTTLRVKMEARRVHLERRAGGGIQVGCEEKTEEV